MKKKFYLIALTNLGFKTVIIFGIKVMAKLDNIIHQVKLEDKSKSKKKARLKSTT